MADLLDVHKGTSASERARAFNRIKAKHVDIVLCAPADLRPVAIIELDDASHQGERRRQRDAFFDAAFASASLPVHRFGVRTAYSVHELREELREHLAPRGEEPVARLEREHRPDSATDARQSDLSARDAVTAVAVEAEAACPNYGSPLVTRVARRGRHVGSQFSACSGYPSCRYVAPTDGTLDCLAAEVSGPPPLPLQACNEPPGPRPVKVHDLPGATISWPNRRMSSRL